MAYNKESNMYEGFIYIIENKVNSSCCSYIRDCCKHLRDTYKDAKWYYQSDISQPDKTKVIA